MCDVISLASIVFFFKVNCKNFFFFLLVPFFNYPKPGYKILKTRCHDKALSIKQISFSSFKIASHHLVDWELFAGCPAKTFFHIWASQLWSCQWSKHNATSNSVSWRNHPAPPRTRSQTANKHIETECLSLCLSRPVFTKKRKDVSCFWQINSYITSLFCSQASRGGGKRLSVGGITNYIVLLQSWLLNASFSRFAGLQQQLWQKKVRSREQSISRSWGCTERGALEEQYLGICECVIGQGGDMPWVQTTRLTSDMLLPQSFLPVSFPHSLFFLKLSLCFQCFLFCF